MWTCKKCQHDNPDATDKCKQCNEFRPLEPLPAETSSNSGDVPVSPKIENAPVVSSNLIVPMIAVVVIIGIALTVMAGIKAQNRKNANCMSNLKQLGLGMMMYQADYDEYLPLKDNWCEGVYPYIKNESVFVCPRLPKSRSGYAYNAGLDRISLAQIFSPAEKILLFDATGGWNQSGENDIVSFRHRMKDPYARQKISATGAAYADGHAKWISQDSSPLQGLINDDLPGVTEDTGENEYLAEEEAWEEESDEPVDGEYGEGAGMQSYDSPLGFTIDYPASWSVETETVSYGERVSFKSGDDNLLCKVERSRAPADKDLKTATDELVNRFRKNTKISYREIRLEPTYLAGEDGWLWEFERKNSAGYLIRTYDIFIRSGDWDWALLLRAPSSELDSWKPVFDTISQSFMLE